MTCSHCGHDITSQATFCSRCGTRTVASPRGQVRQFLITRVAQPWWRFICESPLAFSLVSALYILILGLVYRIAQGNFFSLPPIGFSSPTAASKANFAKAIDARWAELCIPIGLDDMSPLPTSMANLDSRFPLYNALTKAGLLTATDTQVKPPPFTIGSSDILVAGHIYALTDKGRRALKNSKQNVFARDIMRWMTSKTLRYQEMRWGGQSLRLTILLVLRMFPAGFQVISKLPSLA